ncbi:hypothetical protein C8Q78DRAFT_419421 [Trametes maxima]|nr:hypothetical protein C8Q78DRAFT_419421 [Trametes maxima]
MWFALDGPTLGNETSFEHNPSGAMHGALASNNHPRTCVVMDITRFSLLSYHCIGYRARACCPPRYTLFSLGNVSLCLISASCYVLHLFLIGRLLQPLGARQCCAPRIDMTSHFLAILSTVVSILAYLLTSLPSPIAISHPSEVLYNQHVSISLARNEYQCHSKSPRGCADNGTCEQSEVGAAHFDANRRGAVYEILRRRPEQPVYV